MGAALGARATQRRGKMQSKSSSAFIGSRGKRTMPKKDRCAAHPGNAG
jgi:hypothetical protein